MSDRKTVAPGLVEKRAFGRRNTVQHAWIVAGQHTRIACCIRNLSQAGALLEMDVPEWLPTTFELVTDVPPTSVSCEIRHRGRHGVGVVFIGAVTGAGLDEAATTMQPTPTPEAPKPRLELSPVLSQRGLRVPV